MGWRNFCEQGPLRLSRGGGNDEHGDGPHLAIAALVVANGFSVGCETMEGFGKDVENAGEEIQEDADDE